MIDYDISDIAVLKTFYLYLRQGDYDEVFTHLMKVNDDILHSTCLDTLKGLVNVGLVEEYEGQYALTGKGIQTCFLLFDT
jgi:hypothetical protein